MMRAPQQAPEALEGDMEASDAGSRDRLYAFGLFVADPVTGSLYRDGVSVALTLKSFKVLIALIERRGQVVEKDSLLNLVWPDVIVEENNLARHISTLRKVLNDPSHDHAYIVTVSRRGYRFIAPVQELRRTDFLPTPAPTNASPVDNGRDIAGAHAAPPSSEIARLLQTRTAGLAAA